MKKRAFLFPGQGAQIVGMGKDFFEKYEEAKEIYEKASEIAKVDIAKLCFNSEEEVLNKTENTQLAILTTSLAILEVVKKNEITADICAGLSLGEYTALIYSGMLNFEDGIRLIQKRGLYMGTLLPKENYSMAAVIGLESNKIEEICQEIRKNGDFVVPANYNYSAQTAISGEEKAVEVAMEKLKEAGAKKVIKLKTSGPFHTEKLSKAKEEYEKELEKVSFKKGNIPVIKNIDGKIYKEDDNIRNILANHIVCPVRFDKTIKTISDYNIEEYIEIGPGKVLTGFVKKENREANTFSISKVEDLENYLSM